MTTPNEQTEYHQACTCVYNVRPPRVERNPHCPIHGGLPKATLTTAGGGTKVTSEQETAKPLASRSETGYEAEIEEILRAYYLRMVREAMAHSTGGIEELAEVSKVVRAEATAAIKAMLSKAETRGLARAREKRSQGHGTQV